MANHISERVQNVAQQHLDKISSAIGASPEATRDALNHVVPALVAAFQRKISGGGSAGAEGLLGQLGHVVDTGAEGAPTAESAEDQLRRGDTSTLQTRGTSMLESLFGNELPQMVGDVANRSALDAGSVKQLLGLLAPIVLGMIQQQADPFAEETERQMRPDKQDSSVLSKILPIVGILLLALALWWFFGRSQGPENPEPYPETDDIELDINIPGEE